MWRANPRLTGHLLEMFGPNRSSVARMGSLLGGANFQQVRTVLGTKTAPYKTMKRPGGSYLKWYFEKKYKRWTDSKYHYPEVSAVTGEKIDWLYGTAKSGYEGSAVWGPNTLELKGMPMGKTPEYMQERLRRFFSKFGPVVSCRAMPHPRDPYQCQGTAYVTFRSREAVTSAIRAPLIFPLSLHSKVVSMRDLDTDKTNDPLWIHKQKHYNQQCVQVAKQLFAALQREGEPRPMRKVWHGIFERDFVVGKGRVGKSGIADRCVYERFGGWEQFLTSPVFEELFAVSPAGGDARSQTVSARVVSREIAARTFVRAEAELAKQLHAVCSVHWREGKPELPEWTKKQVAFWDHKPALPLDIQYQSRLRTVYKVFDEAYVEKMRRRYRFRERRAMLRKLDHEREVQLQREKEEHLMLEQQSQAQQKTLSLSQMIHAHGNPLAPAGASTASGVVNMNARRRA